MKKMTYQQAFNRLPEPFGYLALQELISCGWHQPTDVIELDMERTYNEYRLSETNLATLQALAGFNHHTSGLGADFWKGVWDCLEQHLATETRFDKPLPDADNARFTASELAMPNDATIADFKAVEKNTLIAGVTLQRKPVAKIFSRQHREASGKISEALSCGNIQQALLYLNRKMKI